MQEVKESLKAIQGDINTIKVDVAKNTVSLEHHVKRTDISERRLERLEQLLIALAVVSVLGGIIKLLIS